MNISNELAIVMKQANLPLTLDGIKKVKAALSVMPKTGLISKLLEEAGNIIDNTVNDTLNSVLETQKQQYKDQKDERNSKAFKEAFEKAKEYIEKFSPKSPAEIFVGEHRLKADLTIYGVTIFDNDLQEKYKQMVNQMLKEKNLDISI